MKRLARALVYSACFYLGLLTSLDPRTALAFTAITIALAIAFVILVERDIRQTLADHDRFPRTSESASRLDDSR